MLDHVKIIATLMAGAKNPVSCGMDAEENVYLLDQKGKAMKEAPKELAEEMRATIKRGLKGPPQPWRAVDSIKVREELKDRVALERHLSHGDMHSNVYRRLEERGYFKNGEITDKGNRLIAEANE